LRAFPHRERIEALHGALISGLRKQMTAAGWHVDPTVTLDTGDGRVGLFRLPLNQECSVTALFMWKGNLPPMEVDTVIGVSYERTFRVWPYLLSGYPHSEVRVGVEDLDRVASLVHLWELGEVDGAVERLVTPVLAHAVSWAKPLASLEALLARLSTSADPDSALTDTPVLLAGAGRIGEARHALASAQSLYPEEAKELLVGSYLGKLTAWLDAGAPPMPPSEP
jgi:hypothetical protein